MLPFNTQKLAALMRSHLEAPPPPPQTLVPELSPRWAEITLKALSKRPDDRYPDARAMREALLTVLDRPVDIIPPTPLPALTPIPVQIPTPPTHVQRPQRPPVDVDVLDTVGTPICSAQGVELSKDGVFLAAPSFSPPLFARLRIALHGNGGALGVECEVVRQVTPAQAASWGMSEGVGVQFVGLSEVQRRALAALLRGERLPSDTPTLNEPIPDLSPVLGPLRAQVEAAGTDLYALLDMSPDADVSAIRDQARDLRKVLKGCQSPRASREQRSAAEVLQAKVEYALQTLTDPARRAEYDAMRGNPAGVAQAIAAGLTVTELERIHRRYVQEHPRAVSNATLEATCGRAYEQQGEMEKAAEAYERALRHDPLDLSVHQRLMTLRRRRVERMRTQA
jgi:serine/threonine-protein kinase